jgi:hypothetical protein
MFTRRTLLKRGGCAVLATAVPMLIRTARAQAANFNYFISPAGSDSNPGTLASPWSINAINSKQSLYAGKSVGVMAGTYNIYSLCQALASSGSQQTAALSINGGTSSSPTLIASCNAAGVYTPRVAIITAANPSGGGYPSNPCGMIGQGGGNPPPNLGNVIIDGFYITRGFQYGVNFYLNSTEVAINSNGDGGASGIEVRNCEIFDIGGVVDNNVAGLFLQNCTGAWIHNNKIHSVQPSTGGNATDVAGIFSYYCYSNIYEYNTIYDCNQAFRDKFYPNGNHTLRYNYVEVNGLFPTGAIGDGSGGSVGDTYSVYNNVFNVIGAGAALWYSNVWPGGKSENTGYAFYNNTCIFPSGGNGAFLPAGGANVGAKAKVSHYNNVYQYAGTPNYQGVIAVVAGGIGVSDYNLYGAGAAGGAFLTVAPYSNAGAPSNAYTLSGWQNALGVDAHSAAVNPSFLSPTSLNAPGFALIAGTAGSASGSNPGRVGGVAGGGLVDMGAWGGASPPSQIGCNFSAVGAIPNPPVILSVS